jgi:hypothetical protein
MEKAIALDFIKNNSLIGLKAGQERPVFLEIWMVVVDDRIFARSWGLATKSWYNTFLVQPSGQIKCGSHIFNISACIPPDNAAMTPSINAAYLNKYNSAHNIKYAQGIIEEQHVNRTMEFIIEAS